MTNTAKITPRDPGFSFDDDLPINWHSNDPAISHFYNGLSLTFPEGERFFVDSVRHFADQITDLKLKSDVRGFAGQEAIHSREHVIYNQYLASQGLEPEKIERLGDLRVAHRAQTAQENAARHHLRTRTLHCALCRSDPGKSAHNGRRPPAFCKPVALARA